MLVQDPVARALWIDTVNEGFPTQHASDIAREFLLRQPKTEVYGQSIESQVTSIVARIQVYVCGDIYNVLTAIEAIRQHLEREGSAPESPTRLLVIDSLFAVLTGVVRGTDVVGRATMMHASRELRQLASDFNLVILITTMSVQASNPEETAPSVLATNTTKPGLGSSWRYATDLQLCLTRLDRTSLGQVQETSNGSGIHKLDSDLFADDVDDENGQETPIVDTDRASMTRLAEITKSTRLGIGEWCLFSFRLQ
ncbi:hypothetical protein BG011_001072 [Mortierella polycephala]|uniref:DNA recombination and repair protein Rad51-like C-terminal domain-containing protein n=1 Tax=Mortierella polycephala TaxID=41804 RepID=A0A9P6U692_9FUNG|nr:hypothetical protein BG011_001072 [Mortierella polycephala]